MSRAGLSSSKPRRRFIPQQLRHQQQRNTSETDRSNDREMTKVNEQDQNEAAEPNKNIERSQEVEDKETTKKTISKDYSNKRFGTKPFAHLLYHTLPDVIVPKYCTSATDNNNSNNNNDEQHQQSSSKCYFNITSQTIAGGDALWVDISGTDDLTLSDWRTCGEELLLHDIDCDIHPHIVNEVVGPDAFPQSVVVGSSNYDVTAELVPASHRPRGDEDGEGENKKKPTKQKSMKDLFRVGDGGCDCCLAILRAAYEDPPLGSSSATDYYNNESSSLSSSRASSNSIQSVSTRLCVIVVPSKHLILTVHRRHIEMLDSMMRPQQQQHPKKNNNSSKDNEKKKSSASSSSRNNNDDKEHATSDDESQQQQSYTCEYETRFKNASPAHLINTIFKRCYKAYLDEITRCVIRFDNLESQLFSSEIEVVSASSRNSSLVRQKKTSSSSGSKSLLKKLSSAILFPSSSSSSSSSPPTDDDRVDLARRLYQLKRRSAVYSRILVMVDDTYNNLVSSVYPVAVNSSTSSNNQQEKTKGNNNSNNINFYDVASPFSSSSSSSPSSPSSSSSSSSSSPLSDPFVQDVMQYNAYTRSLADNLSENIQNTVQLLFQLSSHKMNALMKVLTKFSAFFIPLSFFVSIFGMNFEHIPLTSAEDFPKFLSLLSMLAMGLTIWFGKKF